ncbi:BA75_01681T0 [Komagataella pastoris]|uniref:BA75_01681T0 n=1 Tax=Komagataella pastoris TaxID=4922 RepID=A0A1B2J964_PICPA|nr:BA75_01681T0 [Komagataella pastoris]
MKNFSKKYKAEWTLLSRFLRETNQKNTPPESVIRDFKASVKNKHSLSTRQRHRINDMCSHLQKSPQLYKNLTLHNTKLGEILNKTAGKRQQAHSGDSGAYRILLDRYNQSIDPVVTRDINNEQAELLMRPRDDAAPAMEKDTTKLPDEKSDVTTEEIDALKVFLLNAKKTRDLQRESMFNAKKIYEWTQNNKQNRTFENKTFFTPVCVPKTLVDSKVVVSNDLLFPIANSHSKKEYMIMHRNGSTSKSSVNPLGPRYIPRDMFTILSQLSDPEVYSKKIAKLHKQNWHLIGEGMEENQLLVFERESDTKSKTIRLGRTLLGGVAAVFLVIVLYPMPLTKI